MDIRNLLLLAAGGWILYLASKDGLLTGSGKQVQKGQFRQSNGYEETIPGAAAWGTTPGVSEFANAPSTPEYGSAPSTAGYTTIYRDGVGARVSDGRSLGDMWEGN